ncbi:TraV family lipoprotein [Ursidibacter arcticus]
MKKIVIVVCMAKLLTACSGLNSEFEHSIPAKDSGYWLQQADEMTNKESEGDKNTVSVGSSQYIDIKKYKLVNTGNLHLPVKKMERNIFAEGGANTIGGTNTMNQVSSEVRYEPYDSFCKTKYCYPEPNSPFRELDRISRVWLAPYLSPDNNVHLGEIVYFISKPSKWAGVEGDK